MDQLKHVMRARTNGLSAAREKLEHMLAAKRQLAVDIENLEARLKMIEVAQTTSQFNFDDSQLARTRELIGEIGTRLDVTEKMMNHHQRIPLSSNRSSANRTRMGREVRRPGTSGVRWTGADIWVS